MEEEPGAEEDLQRGRLELDAVRPLLSFLLHGLFTPVPVLLFQFREQAEEEKWRGGTAMGVPTNLCRRQLPSSASWTDWPCSGQADLYMGPEEEFQGCWAYSCVERPHLGENSLADATSPPEPWSCPMSWDAGSSGDRYTHEVMFYIYGPAG